MKKNTLQKNDVIEIIIDNIGINGEGVARYDGVAIFIKGALPGEKVRAKIILVKSAFCVAIVEEILVKSKSRTKPLCPVFGKCGGCSLQHFDYKEQLKYKQKKVAETLLKVGGIRFEVSKTVASERAYGYRNKLSLPVRGAEFTLGFFAAGSHRIVPINECAIQFEGNKKLIRIFCEFMRENHLTGYEESTSAGDVRHLVARDIGGVTVITLVTPRADLPQIKALQAMLESEYKNSFALYLNYNAKNTNVILGERTQFIGGNSAPILVDGVNIYVHPSAFFQVNDFIRKAIYERVAACSSGAVLECYSGAGLLSCILSKTCKSVVSIELDKEAHAAALKNLELNKISSVTALCGDCAQEATHAIELLPKGERTVILDPPRTGCDASVLEAVTGIGANKIIYVSCSPATLARDLKACLAKGYTLQSVEPYDMFPQTMEVETVCVLVKDDKEII